MSEDKKFVNGMHVKPPRDKAPHFVKCTVSIKLDEFAKWIKPFYEDGKDWINIGVLESKKGTWYASLNEWEPKKDAQAPIEPDDPFDDRIPF